jgi:DnaJ-class molecular chaperone
VLDTVLKKPLGVCDVCHALTNLHEAVNHRCNEVVHGRRCYGHYKSSLGHLWDRCEGCNGTGHTGSMPCASCKGFGWLLYA